MRNASGWGVLRRGLWAAFGGVLTALALHVAAAADDGRLAQADVGLDAYSEAAGESAPEVNAFDAYAAAEGQELQMSVIDRTESGVQAFHEKLQEKYRLIPHLGDEIVATLTQASPNQDPTFFLNVLLILAVGLALGVAFAMAVYGNRIVGPWFQSLLEPDPQGYVGKVPILALRVVIGVIGAVVAVVVALIFGMFFYDGRPETNKTAIVWLGTYFVAYSLLAVHRMALSPFLERYRIPCFSNADARKLFWWQAVVSSLSIASLAFCIWMHVLGMAVGPHNVIFAFTSLGAVIANLALIYANKEAISNAIRGGRGAARTTGIGRAAAKLWAPLATLYLVVAWIEMTYRLILDQPLGTPLIAGAYVVFTVLIAVYGGVNYAIEVAFTRRTLRHEEPTEGQELIEGADGALAPAPPRGMRTFEDLARRVASITAVVAGAWAIVWIWNADGMMADESAAFTWLFDLSITAFIGYVAFHASRIWLDQKIQDEGADVPPPEPGDEGGGAAAASRLATLLPLLRNFTLATIAIITFMMLLVESGVNVTPIFAGAGVVGIAIGFGAQTLVRDVFSGIFFLVDDAFRKGEYIDIGEVKGTVENISVRSFQLRHHLGYLHTIPFGEIQYLTNYSRDWVMMKLPLRLTYDTDVDKVRKLIKTLGQELLEDPEIGHKFLQPLKSQGVYMMEESAMIIRVKFMTKPGEQWVIRKTVYARIRALFESQGIKFAHREVTVHVAGDGAKDMSKETKDAVAGAVRPILDPPDGAAQRPGLAVADDR